LAGLEIAFSREAARQYRRLPKDYKALADIALLRLSQGLDLDLKSVQGEVDVYRIRIGKYRMLFRRFSDTAVVFRIAPRGDAYK